MNDFRRPPLAVAAACLLLISCSSSPFVEGYSWASSPIPPDAPVYLASVTVDRGSGSASVEAELQRLAPIACARAGIRLVGDAAGAAKELRIVAVEREYLRGWQTYRSCLLEAYLYGPGSTLPESVSRVMCASERTLAKSSDLEALLRRALRGLRGSMRGRAAGRP